MLFGTHAEPVAAEPCREGGKLVMPVMLTLLDPLNRVKSVKLDVWTGATGQPRPASAKAPQPVAGDSSHTAHPLTADKGLAQAEIEVPALPAGKVYWLQPILTTSTGSVHWAAAVPYKPSSNQPIERTPAKLAFKAPTAEHFRTLKLQSRSEISVTTAGEKRSASERLEGDALESSTPAGELTNVRVTFAGAKLEAERNGEKVERPEAAVKAIPGFTPIFALHGDGRLKQRSIRIGGGLVPTSARIWLDEMLDRFETVFEATSLSAPGRELLPRETWESKVDVTITTRIGSVYGFNSYPSSKSKFGPSYGPSKGGPKGLRPTQPTTVTVKDTTTYAIRCTYQGQRVAEGGRREAFITLTGNVRTTGWHPGLFRGKVTGHAVFDLDGGFYREVQLSTVADDIGELDFLAAFSGHVTLTRTEGNKLGIKPPALPATPALAPMPTVAARPAPNSTAPAGPATNPPPVGPAGTFTEVKGTVIVATEGEISQADRAMENGGTYYGKDVPVQLSEGKRYWLQMVQGASANIRPFVKIYDGSANLAQTLTGAMEFTAPKTGDFKVVVSSISGRDFGKYKFQLIERDPSDTTALGGAAPVRPTFAGPRGAFVKGKEVFSTKAEFILKSPADRASAAKEFSVKLASGKRYLVEFEAAPGSTARGSLRVLDGIRAVGIGMNRVEMTAPRDGDYKVSVSPFGFQGGNYTLKIWEHKEQPTTVASAKISPTPTSPAKTTAPADGATPKKGKLLYTVNGKVQPTDKLDPEAHPDRLGKVVTYKLTAGKQYIIEMTSTGLDAYLILESPSRDRLAEDDDSAGARNARLVHTPAETGVFRIVATSSDQKGTGTFQLSIHESAP
jgi:hypothetical protein